MNNWYKKIAWNNGLPIMDEYSRKLQRNPYDKDPNSLITAVPQFGTNEREGYPQGYSSHEDDENKKPINIPSGSVLVDQDPPTGEGVGNNDLTERFSDPVDKLKSFDKKPDPVGAHNMPHTMSPNLYNFLSKQMLFRKLNKV